MVGCYLIVMCGKSCCLIGPSQLRCSTNHLKLWPGITFQRNFLKPVCCFQRPLYSSVLYGRTIDQHTRNAYAIFRDDIPAVRVNGRYRVGVCCERSHSSESDASRSGVERPDEGIKLQLFAEELSVTKETLQTGRVLD